MCIIRILETRNNSVYHMCTRNISCVYKKQQCVLSCTRNKSYVYKKQQCALSVFQKHVLCVHEATVCIICVLEACHVCTICVLETCHVCTRNNSVYYLFSRNMSFVYKTQQCVLYVFQKQVICVQ